MKYESNFEYLDLRNRNKLVCDDKHKKNPITIIRYKSPHTKIQFKEDSM